MRSKDWGKKFSKEKLDAAIQKSALKRLVEIDVIIPLHAPNMDTLILNIFLSQDVVQQIVLVATKQSYTGQNAVIDAGWSLG